ncbi:uncharacterized protein LOC118735413 [Rhagoletis pomonella]|uniref:uncharacterized protein LOC118735413 n=1 Tax=Rhagoletis pomonella TaxID=28610 RepID=UPI001786C7A3|nr:uncharacterized protein LOC118735413 [Rhagoletis pomonella]
MPMNTITVVARVFVFYRHSPSSRLTSTYSTRITHEATKHIGFISTAMGQFKCCCVDTLCGIRSFLPITIRPRSGNGSDTFMFAQVPPSLKAANQLLGAPVEREINIECIVKVYPELFAGWYHNEGTKAQR